MLSEGTRCELCATTSLRNPGCGKRFTAQAPRLAEFVYVGHSLHWYIYMTGAHVSRYTGLGSFWLRSHVAASLWRVQPRLRLPVRAQLAQYAAAVYPPQRPGGVAGAPGV